MAAIQRAGIKGASVRWNEDIGGRQFDVTVRFTPGLYDFLTLVEARDYSRPLPASAVDALVTKAKDAKANKAVLVSASGFQKGCYEVAKRHGVELYSLRELDGAAEDSVESILLPVLNYFNFRLICPGETILLPEERNILPFLAQDSTLKTHRGNTSLAALVRSHYDELFRSASNEPKPYRITLPRFSVVEMADIKSGNTLDRITLPVDAVEFLYIAVQGRMLKGGLGLDPYLSKYYEYRNELTGEAARYSPRDLSVGADTEFRPGHFYYDAHSEFRYFCDAVDGDFLTMTLLEGYQHGRHLQVIFKVARENATSYLEVEDPQEIRRLSAMLSTFRSHGHLPPDHPTPPPRQP